MLRSIFAVMMMVAVAMAADAWFVETGFECLKDRSGVASVTFIQHGTTFTITSPGGTVSVVDGVIYPDEPECLTDEEPTLLLTTSSRVTSVNIEVIPMRETAAEAYWITPYISRSGYLYYNEYPMPQSQDGTGFQYTYYPSKMTGVRVVGGALDTLRVDKW